MLLMKAQITRRWITLHWPHYMHYPRTRVGDTLQNLFGYNSKRVKIYSILKSVKLLLVCIV